MSKPAKTGPLTANAGDDDAADLGMAAWGKPGDKVAVADPADPGESGTCSEPSSGAVTGCAACCGCSTVAAVAAELATVLGPERGALGDLVKPPNLGASGTATGA